MIDDELPAFYAGKRVLITGGLGFIGSNLARALVEAGSRVLLVDSLVPEYGGKLENIAGIEDAVEVNISDVRDEHSLRHLVRGQDVLFNLAGQTSHLDSLHDPYTDLEINCRSQICILEACRYFNPGVKVAFASTRQIYGRPRYRPVDERHPVAPIDVNGIHKAAGEAYHMLYGRVYGLHVAALRLTNTYGPGMRVRDARQTFLGQWLRLLLTDEEMLVYGDGRQQRDFNYVDDVVYAFMLVAANKAADGEVYNLGSEDHVSLLELAQLLVEINGTGSYRLIPFPPDRKVIDIGDYFADYSKIRDQLGWLPTKSLRDGLERTIVFYRDRGSLYWGTE